MDFNETGRLILQIGYGRLYDPIERRQLVLGDVWRMVQTGHRIVVMDAKTGADITDTVLEKAVPLKDR